MPTVTNPPTTPGQPASSGTSAATPSARTTATANPGSSADSFSVDHAERPFDVYFTPKENAYKFETKCIEEVIAARKADPVDYPEDQNPYKILYMVYNLRNEKIVKKLFEAMKAGIDVQVLIEADQISDDRPWNKVDDWFEAEGLKVIRSDKDITDAEREGAHLIGIDRKSLMHMKSRLFLYKDPQTGEKKTKVLSGSLNPGSYPIRNDENVNVMTSDKIARDYVKRFYQIRHREPAKNKWHDDRPINVLFTPYEQGAVTTPTKKLFEWIDNEKEMIIISVFALRNLTTKGEQDNLVKKLKKAKDRGVKVMVLTDRRKSDGTDENGEPIMMYGELAHNDLTDEKLEEAGIKVLELVNTAGKHSSVHGKSMVCGLKDMKVLTGAGNWTVAAMGSRKKQPRNEESFIFVESGKLDNNYTGRAYLSNFMELLRRYDKQFPEKAEDMIKELQQLPNGPKVSFDVSAFAKAHAGQEVYFVSDHPAITSQIPAGQPGIKLDTSPNTGTPPFAPQTPIKIPMGTRLKYRVAIKDPQSGAIDFVGGSQIAVVEDKLH
jgi:hypothetical protein